MGQLAKWTNTYSGTFTFFNKALLMLWCVMDIKKLKKFLQVFKNILEEYFYKFL